MPNKISDFCPQSRRELGRHPTTGHVMRTSLWVGFSCCLAVGTSIAAFSDIRPLEDLSDAWRGKTLLVEYDAASKEVTGEWGFCFDFRQFDDCSAAVLDLDRHSKTRGGGHCAVEGGIAKDVPGVANGDFLLSVSGVGISVSDSFQTRPSPSATRFVSTRQQTYTLTAGGGCSGK